MISYDRGKGWIWTPFSPSHKDIALFARKNVVKLVDSQESPYFIQSAITSWRIAQKSIATKLNRFKEFIPKKMEKQLSLVVSLYIFCSMNSWSSFPVFCFKPRLAYNIWKLITKKTLPSLNGKPSPLVTFIAEIKTRAEKGISGLIILFEATWLCRDWRENFPFFQLLKNHAWNQLVIWPNCNKQLKVVNFEQHPSR